MSQRNETKTALLLGMVYSNEKDPLTGQMYRDRVRCEAMERMGYCVKTMDDKHDGDLERETSSGFVEDDSKNFARRGTHVRANFANCRRMLKSIDDTWGSHISFDQIILDYFFCPAGYVNMRWAEGFFRDTLPAFASLGMISKNGSIWLPHAHYVEQMLEKHQDELARHFQWKLVSDFGECPLFQATDDVATELEKCPDRRTNENQIEPLLAVSSCIFYELKPLGEPMTPSSSTRKRGSSERPTQSPSVSKRRSVGTKKSRSLSTELIEE